ncbi:unspecified product [Leptomonas pyrrhocoris]|uniref:Unspecified product n=1 Tax=Leptomonas pyrrhocoris TaxID=157538 RepID=A0A0N0VI69_LEPPY|nr:unspecified product [Leptomonas pyrrhocoris]XP_015665138.1 unspecified product [Leptomonas pyrrhocoris]KPA86698.1 unspecified product [Leptomonas pyrrhocoris]KPA86699.1 unspecified product [Leptomonas pyrrhocoris]|eukprot:XP_015665137.1 unspecified product [Leptomonas pyrrhocoris]
MSLNVSLGPWKADSAVANCESCGAAFNLFHRRHHCRCCGGIFCSTCTAQTFVIPTYPSLIPQRVCRECHALLSSRETGRSQQRDRALLQQFQEHNSLDGDPLGRCSHASQRREQRDSGGPLVHRSLRVSSINSDDIDGSFVDCVERTDTGDDDAADAVSSAVAGVLSSWSEQQHRSSVSFLPVLKDSIVRSGELPLLNVLLFPSPQCYTVSVLMLSKEDTMRDLILRLAEQYFKLANGPFKKITDSAKEDLCSSLQFYSEMQSISPDLSAIEVAAHCTHVVLTTLSPSGFEKERDNSTQESSLLHFFGQHDAVSVGKTE